MNKKNIRTTMCGLDFDRKRARKICTVEFWMISKNQTMLKIENNKYIIEDTKKINSKKRKYKKNDTYTLLSENEAKNVLYYLGKLKSNVKLVDVINTYSIQKIDEIEYDKRLETIKKRRKHNAYMKQYQQRPEVRKKRIEYNRIHNQKPEIILAKREYQKKYNERSDVKIRKKEYQKKYNEKPETIEKTKKYNSRPEVIERTKNYQKKYMQNSKNKKKKQEYNKEYYQKPDVKIRKKRIEYKEMIENE